MTDTTVALTKDAIALLADAHNHLDPMSRAARHLAAAMEHAMTVLVEHDGQDIGASYCRLRTDACRTLWEGDSR